jgi:hypothetical protein
MNTLVQKKINVKTRRYDKVEEVNIFTSGREKITSVCKSPIFSPVCKYLHTGVPGGVNNKSFHM